MWRRRLEIEVQRLKRQIRDQKRIIRHLDKEARRRLALLDEDLLQVREDVNEVLHLQSGHISGQAEATQDLAARVLKLEMQVGRLTLDSQTCLEVGLHQENSGTDGIGSSKNNRLCS